MSKFLPLLKTWFPFAMTISLVCGIIYIVAQQSYRQSANDPQFQMAEDAVSSLAKDVAPKALVPATPFELGRSLSPYLVIYDESGNVAASGIVIDGKAPKLPAGVLDFVKNKGEDVITWQPQRGIRQALVVKRTEVGNLYYVVAGRSLRKTEERISVLAKLVAFGWVCSMGVLFGDDWIATRYHEIKIINIYYIL